MPFFMIIYLICTSVHRPLFTVHCSLFTVHCSLFTVHCSLFTVHCSLLTTHYSLLTAHCSLSFINPLSSAVSLIGTTGKNFDKRVIMISTIKNEAKVIAISVSVGVYTLKL